MAIRSRFLWRTRMLSALVVKILLSSRNVVKVSATKMICHEADSGRKKNSSIAQPEFKRARADFANAPARIRAAKI